ncbi:MAG: hypothetical protein ACK47B_05890 [Armatimonadota bacterium]
MLDRLLFWQNPNASLRAGQVTGRLTLHSLRLGWGEPLIGRVVLRGGAQPQAIDSVRVSLIEDSQLPRDLGPLANGLAFGASVGLVSGMVAPSVGAGGLLGAAASEFQITHAEQVLEYQAVLQPGEVRRWEFALTAPWGRPFESMWRAQLDVWVPGCAAQSRRMITLAPPPLFTRVAAVLEEVARMEVRGWGYRTTLDDKVGRPVAPLDAALVEVLKDQERYPHRPLPEKGLVGGVARLSPGGWPRSPVGGIELVLFLRPPHLVGELLVTPAGRGLRGLADALGVGRPARLGFCVEAGDLPGARREFARLLAPYLQA